MKYSIYFKKVTIPFLFLFIFVNFSTAQKTDLQTPPRQEKLLNGLKILVWNQPAADRVSVKLRIHSGSAFDPQGKEGVMALLADILFPGEQIKEFFAEELGGSLEITSNYDYIQLNAAGSTEHVLTILETIGTAVSNPQIDKETTEKVKNARLEMLKELETDPAYIADRAVRKQLLGNFPYGRPQSGTPATLAKIDFADLLFARERFLTGDNAVLAVSGNVKPELMFRAARRFFGGWRKSEQRVPATFAQPEAPDTKLQLISAENDSINEARFAMRGLARNNKDFFASKILAKILENRLRNELPNELQKNVFITQNSNLLPGMIIIGLSNLLIDVKGQLSEKPPVTHQFSIKEENMLTNLLYMKVTAQEFDKARAVVLAEINQIDPMEFWLDVDTYKLISVKDELQRAKNVTLAEVHSVAENFQKQPAVKIWVVKPPEADTTEN